MTYYCLSLYNYVFIESSKFCQNWAQVLLSQGTTTPDPFFLRHAVENYKLKVCIHNVLGQVLSTYITITSPIDYSGYQCSEEITESS